MSGRYVPSGAEFDAGGTPAPERRRRGLARLFLGKTPKQARREVVTPAELGQRLVVAPPPLRTPTVTATSQPAVPSVQPLLPAVPASASDTPSPPKPSSEPAREVRRRPRRVTVDPKAVPQPTREPVVDRPFPPVPMSEAEMRKRLGPIMRYDDDT